MSTLIEPASLVGGQPLERAATDPCAACGVCCFAYLVPLSAFDVWRISRGLGLDASEFVVGYPCKADAEFGFQLCAGGERFELGLEKRGEFRRGSACVFLESSADGLSRCGVYAVRPSACRAYPMVADADGIRLRSGALCPDGAWPEGEAEQPAWRTAWQGLREESEQQRRIVETWNALVAREPGRHFSMNHYLEYVLGIYDKLAAARHT